MRLGVILASILIMVFLSVQLVNFYKSNSELDKKLATASLEAKQIAAENDRVKGDLEYFSYDENLAKELKAKFDYKNPGEKLIKIQ